MFEFRRDKRQGENLSQVASQAVIVVRESLPQAPLEKLCRASVPPVPLVLRDRGSAALLMATSMPPYKEGHPGNC